MFGGMNIVPCSSFPLELQDFLNRQTMKTNFFVKSFLLFQCHLAVTKGGGGGGWKRLVTQAEWKKLKREWKERRWQPANDGAEEKNWVNFSPFHFSFNSKLLNCIITSRKKFFWSHSPSYSTPMASGRLNN